ncbi:MAG: thioredoxin-dependent thiol peroxidase [Gemmatimonadales bacterium]|nr:MAG: thioredoxin-dependent thiol peroxidase [Gemmatimonadales bacterium]
MASDRTPSRSPAPGPGDPAPDFTLEADRGDPVTLSDLRGSKVVLYFYPKDDTSGCTTQACEFRDALPDIEADGAIVLGVSPDSVESHRKFRDKYDLNFRLLADTEQEAAMAYGVWKEKKMFGNTFMGVERSTFIIDEEGVIREAWRRVRPKGHAEKVTSAL